jgi:hypothetical protein
MDLIFLFRPFQTFGKRSGNGSASRYSRASQHKSNAVFHLLTLLTLSNMAFEVPFMIWQGGQVATPVRTKFAKVKTFWGADYTPAMPCSVMYVPCCQTLICNK